MGIRALGAIAVVAALTLPAGASAAPSTAEQIASEAFEAASDRDPACGPLVQPGKTTVADVPVDPALAEQLAILRRPQTDEDRAAAALLPSSLGTVAAAGIRVAVGPGDRRFVIAPVEQVTRPPRCARVRERKLRRLTKGVGPRIRRAVRAAVDRRLAMDRYSGQRIAMLVDPHVGVTAFSPRATATTLTEGWMGFAVTGDGTAGPALVYGVVRDGVATVEWHYGATVVTAPVRDNVAAAEIAAYPITAEPARIVQRDVSGAVISDVEQEERVLRPPARG